MEALQVKEVVLVAQDLAAYGRDQSIGQKSVIPLIEEIVKKVEWVRLLYLYPSELNTASYRRNQLFSSPLFRSFFTTCFTTSSQENETLGW